MNFILRNLEIILTLAGVAVIFGVTAILSPAGMSNWEVAAITATAVGIIHGVLFWVIRRRQREVRTAAIADIQSMLKDLISNQLAVIDTMAKLRDARPVEARRASDYISRAVTAISDALHHVSDDSLKKWQSRQAELPPE